MKKLVLSVALMLAMSIAHAQNSLPKGDTQFNVGVGLSDYGVPVYIGLDHAVSRDITLGENFHTEAMMITGITMIIIVTSGEFQEMQIIISIIY